MPDRDERIDLGWDLLEQGEPRGALEAAEALMRENPADSEAAFLAATAQIEMGAPDEAGARLEALLSADPDNGPAHLTYAGLLYSVGRLDQAEEQMEGLHGATASEPYARWLTGLLHDARGRREEADTCYAEATRLDPERFHIPVTMSTSEFEEVIQEALAEMPGVFTEQIAAVPIVVEEIPSAALLATLEEASPDLLGLFVGTPATLSSDADPLPPVIYLFKRNLEREANDREDLAEQIRVTLLHEVGHYLGLEEDDLDDAGYG